MKAPLLAALALASISSASAPRQPIFVESPCRPLYEYHFLNRAASGGDFYGVELLLGQGADVNGLGYSATQECGYSFEFSSPLRVAVSTKDLKMVELLLDRGADPNLVEGVGITPTDIARRDGPKEILDLLVKHGGR
ncbi:hypothetical protein GCM10011521_28240 [Arenimonas soli]|uniref:Ankyrin repeat domain-containing protein n=1 Tax=Arenimonas soli TaxID=2269504 RepID=A0ABQ1HTW1_9GAMM|nr:ankyrin repeat domain-containing protein [Arenimonas soli]GGA88221.1 hypothetical protein GCM10011521_28240 [Arenimonas soli]